MSILATDDFNRADANPLDGNWTHGSGFAGLKLASNAVTPITASTDSDAIDTSVTWPNDQWSQVVIGTATGGDGGPAVRKQTNGDGYFVTTGGGNIVMYKITGGGGFTSIGSVAGSWANGDTIYLEIQGTTLIAKQNGTTVLTVTGQTDWASGKAGMHMFSGTLTFDSWQGGDFGASATVEQSSSRFGVDDANEASHTWGAAENSNLTAALGTAMLIRLQLNATGDFVSTAFKLKYQKNGAGGYFDVPVGSTTVYATPTWQSSGTAASGTGAVTAPVPSSFASGDLLIMVVESANQAVATPPSGWTEVSASPQGTGTAAGTTATRLTVYAKIATGSETAVSIGDAGDHTLVNTFAIRGTHQTLATALHVVAGDVASTGSTSVTFPGGTTTVNNCLVINIIANATDTATAQGSGWANANLGSVTEQLDFSTASGNGGGITVITGTLATAGAIGGTTGTLATSSVQGRITLAIRPPATVTNELYVTPSSNIASGGEATTARLTAPSGKTTSSFTTGRRWDDENGSDAIDIASDFYTEVEWSINTQSPAAGNDYYDMRVYAGNAALSPYTSTPRLTISGGVGPSLDIVKTYVPINVSLRM